MLLRTNFPCTWCVMTTHAPSPPTRACARRAVVSFMMTIMMATCFVTSQTSNADAFAKLIGVATPSIIQLAAQLTKGPAIASRFKPVQLALVAVEVRKYSGWVSFESPAVGRGPLAPVTSSMMGLASLLLLLLRLLLLLLSWFFRVNLTPTPTPTPTHTLRAGYNTCTPYPRDHRPLWRCPDLLSTFITFVVFKLSTRPILGAGTTRVRRLQAALQVLHPSGAARPWAAAVLLPVPICIGWLITLPQPATSSPLLRRTQGPARAGVVALLREPAAHVVTSRTTS